MNSEDCTIRIDDETEYGPVRQPSDLEDHARTLQWSFRYPIEDSRLILERMGQEKIRLLRLRDRVVGGLSLYSVGQWFGGRRVPMAGVGVVGIAPEARGHGVATRMMDACVLDARASGHPISVLYPAKQSLYRRSGWELGGSLWNHAVPIAALPGGDRDLEVRECRPEDESAVRALHATIARHRPGEVDRDDWFWERVMRNPRFHVRGFVVEASDGVEGYVFLHETETEEVFGYDLACTDLVAVNARAARRLFRFVADHGSLGRQLRWNGSPWDPMLGLVGEQRWKTTQQFQWMLRIVDVAGALEARGYPPDVDVEVQLDIEDELVGENRGRFTLGVRDGRGVVSVGGAGRAVLHVRALASLYTGWLRPRDAVAYGWLRADDTTVDALERVFAGPTAWMSDMF